MLEEAKVDYRHLRHEPTRTSEEASRVRGEPLAIGGKVLVIKAGSGQDARFAVMVLSAPRRLDSVASRKALGVGKSRFATREELNELTGLVPGSVPPFGEPILPLPLYVDESIFSNERIAFNAGSLTDSIIMSTADYRRLARIREIVRIARPD